MKTIKVSTDVFAAIWSLRKGHEQSENDILSRVLLGKNQPTPPISNTQNTGVRWVDDVSQSLKNLGGKATLSAIYKEVSKIRRANGRSIPASLEATIRRTLEDFSSESHNYRNNGDFFYMPEGKGLGIWSLRKIR